MVKLKTLFFCVGFAVNVKCQTSTYTLWSDAMDSYPSDWDITINTELESSSINCVSSNLCWNVKGSGGEIVHAVNTLNYNNINLEFNLNVNLGNNEFCQIYYRYYNDGTLILSSWIFLDEYDSNLLTLSNILLPILANNRSNIDIQFINTGKQQNTDSCYLDDIAVYGDLITQNPTISPNDSPTSSPNTPNQLQPTRSPNDGNVDTDTDTDTEQQNEEYIIFDSWSHFGAFMLITFIMGCCGFAPLLNVIYLLIKETLIDMFGARTTGIVNNKEIKKKSSKHGYRYEHILYYVYTVNEIDYSGKRRVGLNYFNDVSIGQFIDVDYLPCFPCWSKGEYSCCHYVCYVLMIIFFCIWCGIVFMFISFIWSSYDNWSDFVLWFFIGALICSLPCLCLSIFKGGSYF